MSETSSMKIKKKMKKINKTKKAYYTGNFHV